MRIAQKQLIYTDALPSKKINWDLFLRSLRWIEKKQTNESFSCLRKLADVMNMIIIVTVAPSIVSVCSTLLMISKVSHLPISKLSFDISESVWCNISISVQRNIIFPRFANAHHVNHVHSTNAIRFLLHRTHSNNANGEFEWHHLHIGMVSLPTQRSTVTSTYDCAITKTFLHQWIRHFCMYFGKLSWCESMLWPNSNQIKFRNYKCTWIVLQVLKSSFSAYMVLRSIDEK